MSIDRAIVATRRGNVATSRAIGIAIVALLALQPAVSGQDAGEQSTAGEQTAQAQQAQPVPDRSGNGDLGQLPDDPGRPGEPPPIVEEGDPGMDEVQESGLGSFFLTDFSVASAYDRTTRAEGEPLAPVTNAITTSGEGEISYLLRPSLMFVHRPDARGGLVVAYEPELETLQDDDDDGEERVSHSAGLLFERRMTRRTDISAGASYLDSLDPSRHLGGEGFVLIPGRYEQERVYLGASHLWPRATRLHFYSEYSSALTDLETDATALDVSDLSGTLALEQGIGRSSDVTFSYSYTDTEVETLEPGVDAPIRFSGPIDAFRIGFGHRAGLGYSFHLSGGALRETADEEQLAAGESDDDISWIGAAEVARDTEKLKLRLRYDRSLFSFGYGESQAPVEFQDPLSAGTVLRDTTSDTASFHLEATPHSRVRFEQSVWLSRQSVIAGDDIESFVTGTLVEVLLTGGNVHRLMLFSSFDYYDRGDSELLGGDLSRTRFSLGFRVGLSGPQTKVGQQLALAELRKVLPTAGRL